jgi:hypothetical protein
MIVSGGFFEFRKAEMEEANTEDLPELTAFKNIG